MDFSPEQDRALIQVKRWLERGDQQVFKLFGYAGTGKTTLAKHFSEGVNGRVMFGAFTGKAAYVLQSKGCEGATTIHSMIYLTKEKSKHRLMQTQEDLDGRKAELSIQGYDDEAIARDDEVINLNRLLDDEQLSLKRPLFKLNPDSEVKNAALVIVDEVSMINERMATDLLSYGTPVLVLGDPAQLPPVGGTGFFTDEKYGKPDIMLTEIHRQAKESPIIALATRVRQGQRLSVGGMGDCVIVTKTCPEEMLGVDQILVGKNSTRSATNKRMRELLKFEGLSPQKNDKLVCLRNNHEAGLLNGSLWRVKSVLSNEELAQLNAAESGEDGDPFDYDPFNPTNGSVDTTDDQKIGLTIEAELGSDVQHVTSHVHYFEGRDKELGYWEKKEAEEFDYGYAMTVHKAQGSQWDHVALFDQSHVFGHNRHKWLYTAITRAAKSIRIIL